MTIGSTKQSVRFDRVEIIELPIIIGDNPSASTGGPPMSVDWHAMRRTEFGLEFYEKFRPRRKTNRRDMITSCSARTNFFLKCGYSMEEIEEAAQTAARYKKQVVLSRLVSSRQTLDNTVRDRFASQSLSASSQRQEKSLVAPLRGESPKESRQFRKSHPNRDVACTATASLPEVTPTRPLRRRSSDPSVFSSQPLSPPTRSASPTDPMDRKKLNRKNSPTADCINTAHNKLNNNNNSSSQVAKKMSNSGNCNRKHMLLRLSESQFLPEEELNSSPGTMRMALSGNTSPLSSSDSLLMNVPMPLRKLSPPSTERKIPTPPKGSPPSSVKPRRKISPPITSQKTISRSM